MKRVLLALGFLSLLASTLSLVSCSGAVPKDMLLSLTTGKTDGAALDKVLDKFGKPEYAFAPAPVHVELWYRVRDKECSRYDGLLNSCHVALMFSVREDCDTSKLSCYSLKTLEFPVFVKRISSDWIQEEMQDWYEYSNPSAGPQMKEEFSRGQTIKWRTDFPEPLPELKSALGL
jgi:hypothetical protein